jgi:N-methylhydantoinase A
MRMVSLARGHDPRDFALVAFGGAGPLHAVALARELGIPTVLIPARPGLTNALGCLVADLRHDYVRTVNKPLAVLEEGVVRRILEEQIEEGRRTIERERVAVEEIVVLHRAEMQFQGQSHLLAVEIPAVGITRDELQKAFEAAYWHRFEVELPEIRAVLVNLHTAVIGKRKRIGLEALAAAGAKATPEEAIRTRRRVWFEDSGWLDTPVYTRDALPLGARLDGPAIIEQLDATTVIEPGNRVEIDRLGNLIVRVTT